MTPVKHRTKQQVIERLFKPECIPAKGQWGNQMAMLGKLTSRYSDDRFWGELNLGYAIHSLAFFQTDEGAAILEHHWRLHQLAANQSTQKVVVDHHSPGATATKNVLDNQANSTTIPPIESPAPKQNALTWASS